MQRILEQEEDDYQYGGGDYYDENIISYTCTSWAPAVGFLGITCAVVFASEYKYCEFKGLR